MFKHFSHFLSFSENFPLRVKQTKLYVSEFFSSFFHLEKERQTEIERNNDRDKENDRDTRERDRTNRDDSVFSILPYHYSPPNLNTNIFISGNFIQRLFTLRVRPEEVKEGEKKEEEEEA